MFKLLVSALLLGGGASAWVGCTKEQGANPSTAPVAQDHGSTKIEYYLFAIINGSAPYQFNVTKGTDPAYGTLIASSGAAKLMLIDSQNGSTLYVQGTTSPCGGLTNGSDCEFDKNSTGSYYYITPNQGPSSGKVSLKLRVKTGVTVPTRSQWFKYDASANTWTIDPSASTYFDYTTVTSFTTTAC